MTYKIVQRLRAPGSPLSRNRHYSVFETAEGRRALGIHKRVRGVEADLLNSGNGSDVSLTPETDDLVRLDIRLPHLRAKRTSYLSRTEIDILLGSRAGSVLRQAGWIG